MLKHLYISSFVIIDEIHVDFHEGMNVLTGETGAGKSIIIDALGQLCGNRSSISFIKKNRSKAVIEGIFDVDMTSELETLCHDLHIEPDEEFVISKEILASGKSNIKINYQNASNNALKILTPYLLDIHSQFETQKIFEEKNHLALLDDYAFSSLKKIKDEYYFYYQQYKDYSEQLKFAIEEDLSDEQLEFLQSQVDEIAEMPYNDSEVDELEEELKMLQNFEKVSEKISHFQKCMKDDYGALSLFKEALSYIESIHEYSDFEEIYDHMYNLYYAMLDDYEKTMDLYHEFHFDEYRFQELQETIFKINRLKRKYGFTMERISEYKDELMDKINMIKHREEFIHDLKEKVKNAQNEALKVAQKLHDIRQKYALCFEKEIMQQLQDLYLEKAVFKIEFLKTDLTMQGIDKVRFMIAVNKGQNLSLLNESASGGEISRIMLAIKIITLAYSSIGTIIFDEVDTGVSGKVASSIGEKMHNLAKTKQVICITHLPQVACLADHHYNIEKQSSDESTVTSIHLLDEKERIQEIAKMLSGETISKEAIENAKKLLNV